MPQQVLTRAFHAMAKPSSSDCNLNCAYCFYLEKQALYTQQPALRMDDATLETYVRDYIAAIEPQDEVAFTWQGRANPDGAGFLSSGGCFAEEIRGRTAD